MEMEQNPMYALNWGYVCFEKAKHSTPLGSERLVKSCIYQDIFGVLMKLLYI